LSLAVRLQDNKLGLRELLQGLVSALLLALALAMLWVVELELDMEPQQELCLAELPDTRTRTMLRVEEKN
jgi:hypothetical protein